MTKRDKRIIFDFLHHFLVDGWQLRLDNCVFRLGPIKESDLTEKGLARLARLMPYLSLRKEGEKIYVDSNFKAESEIPTEHLILYYKTLYSELKKDYDQLTDKVAELAERY